MTFDELIRTMTPEIHERLRRAVETRRWADGRPLSAEQMESSLQAVMAYEAFCLDTGDEPYRITAEGEIRPAKKPETARHERLPLQFVNE